MRGNRALAIGGVLGPAAFVTAWSVLGASATGYSAVHDSISRLAAMDAPTRGAMTAGLVAFATGVPIYALALRSALPGRTWMLAAAAGLATGGVAAFPLGSPASDRAHVACVTVAYGALAATPLGAARTLARRGRSGWSRFSGLSGLVGGALLVASVTTGLSGLFQRAGLGVLDAWVVASAVGILRGKLHPRGHPE